MTVGAGRPFRARPADDPGPRVHRTVILDA
jgi:hypothetical protein